MKHHTPANPAPAGRVTLVGAGPGDPELLTIKAVRAIENATLLLVDDLVNPDILALARPEARVIQVGKRGGCQSTPQAFIEKLMIAGAQDGEQVVRLKGGDPLIFGRGGEETEHLQAAGVRVDVVNGITAGLAAVTSLGVPLTHRHHAHGVLFITGHAHAGEPVDWPLLAQTAARARLTLVIYMGVSHAGEIQQQLLSALPADTPVAIVTRASLPEQQQAVSRLDDLAATLTREGLASPAIIVVGDVLRGLAAARAQIDAASGPLQSRA
jgi:uroporphyrin-III C-methyltransferase